MLSPIFDHCRTVPSSMDLPCHLRFTFFSTVLLSAVVTFLQVPMSHVAADSKRTGFFPHAISLADFNNDGHLDMAIPASAERKVTILLGDGKGGIIANHAYPVGQGPTWVETADFNGDGHVDLVTTNTGAASLTIYFGDGQGGFGGRQEIEGIHGPASVVAADFNRDGRSDLAVAQAARSK